MILTLFWSPEHLRIWYMIYSLLLGSAHIQFCMQFGRSRALLKTVLVPHVNPWVIRTLEQLHHLSLWGGGWRWNRDHRVTDWVWHMVEQLKIKPDTRISHTKYKVIDSTKQTDAVRYLKRKNGRKIKGFFFESYCFFICSKMLIIT